MAILEEAQSGDEDSAAALYITHHYSQLSALDFQRFFGIENPDLAESEKMLSRLVLVRVGLYPEEEERPGLARLFD